MCGELVFCREKTEEEWAEPNDQGIVRHDQWEGVHLEHQEVTQRGPRGGGGVERGLRCQIRFGSRTLSELADGGDALLGNAKDEFEVLEQLACCVGIHARNGFGSNSQTASARKSGQICQDAKAEKKTSVVSQRTVFLLFVR